MGGSQSSLATGSSEGRSKKQSVKVGFFNPGFHDGEDDGSRSRSSSTASQNSNTNASNEDDAAPTSRSASGHHQFDRKMSKRRFDWYQMTVSRDECDGFLSQQRIGSFLIYVDHASDAHVLAVRCDNDEAPVAHVGVLGPGDDPAGPQFFLENAPAQTFPDIPSLVAHYQRTHTDGSAPFVLSRAPPVFDPLAASRAEEEDAAAFLAGCDFLGPDDQDPFASRRGTGSARTAEDLANFRPVTLHEGEDENAPNFVTDMARSAAERAEQEAFAVEEALADLDSSTLQNESLEEPLPPLPVQPGQHSQEQEDFYDTLEAVIPSEARQAAAPPAGAISAHKDGGDNDGDPLPPLPSTPSAGANRNLLPPRPELSFLDSPAPAPPVDSDNEDECLYDNLDDLAPTQSAASSVTPGAAPSRQVSAATMLGNPDAPLPGTVGSDDNDEDEEELVVRVLPVTTMYGDFSAENVLDVKDAAADEGGDADDIYDDPVDVRRGHAAAPAPPTLPTQRPPLAGRQAVDPLPATPAAEAESDSESEEPAYEYPVVIGKGASSSFDDVYSWARAVDPLAKEQPLWLHGTHLQRHHAERLLLKHGGDGVFLVRARRSRSHQEATLHKFVLSIAMNRSVEHYLIRCDPTSYSMAASQSFSAVSGAATLEELVSMVVASMPVKSRLHTAIIIAKVDNHSSYPEWFHPEIDRSTARQRLSSSSKQDGVFLVRNSSGGGFALSVIVNGKVFHHLISARGSSWYYDEHLIRGCHSLESVISSMMRPGGIPNASYCLSTCVRRPPTYERLLFSTRRSIPQNPGSVAPLAAPSAQDTSRALSHTPMPLPSHPQGSTTVTTLAHAPRTAKAPTLAPEPSTPMAPALPPARAATLAPRAVEALPSSPTYRPLPELPPVVPEGAPITIPPEAFAQARASAQEPGDQLYLDANEVFHAAKDLTINSDFLKQVHPDLPPLLVPLREFEDSDTDDDDDEDQAAAGDSPSATASADMASPIEGELLF
eukprot:m.301841 g.301841  ORF g.301841 m.301841 type:complete len:999 (-) comp14942_c0_seq1:138-3134(-)